ncbi:MAG TPA: GrpB family protein [Candidatus Paceibacterota bacterium]
MLTKEQEEWVNHLRERPIPIVPYDPRTPELFAAVEARIKRILGPEAVVVHCGASSFGISGQDEIDVSIECEASEFDSYVVCLEKEFGAVKSRYPDRARFEVKQDGKKIDLKLCDRRHPNYVAGKIFEDFLHKNPADLERYRILKEKNNGVSVKEYYRQKNEFINEILERAKQ